MEKGSRVFLPLCGKTLDIAWLLAQGYKLVGAELAEMAIQQLFADLRVEPTISDMGGPEGDSLKLYCAENIDIFVGDIFNVSAHLLGPVDAIYDRAALVALPPAMRDRYTAHLNNITHRAPQLLITFEYDQTVMPGPPFSITSQEVARHYGDSHQLTALAGKTLPGGLKGKCEAKETVWLLAKTPK